MKRINVTKSVLPEKKVYQDYVNRIWETGWLTNHGPFVTQLEERLKDYLGVDHLILVNNGTIALQIAIKVLNLDGNIITTPFSYVATTSAIKWEHCTPVFADIDPESLNINPVNIEKKINKKTSAILATHVYGNPCDVEAIKDIAAKYDLKVIFDAAHAFAVEFKNQSLLNFGDISILSFHATKIFHTIEGGALITNSRDTANKIRFLRNFGHDGPENFNGVGINGKMNEFCAAMGLSLLPKMDFIINRRKRVHDWYKEKLTTSMLLYPVIQKDTKYNFAYFPVIFEKEKALDKCIEDLNKNNIYPRRYFKPSLNTLSYVNYDPMPISEDISSRILCLPIYPDLEKEEVHLICSIINHSLNA